MKWFLDMRIASKLLVTFALVLSLSTFLGMFSILKLASVQETSVDLGGNRLGATRTIASISKTVSAYRRWEMRLILELNDPVGRKIASEGLAAAGAAVKKALDEYQSFLDNPEEKRRYAVLLSKWNDYSEASRQLQDLAIAGKNAQTAAYLRGDSFKRFTVLVEEADSLEESQKTLAAQELQHGIQIYSSARTRIIVVLCASVAIGLAMGVWIARTVSRPINEVKNVAERIAAGDLTGCNIDIATQDEVGRLAQSINKMQTNLRELVQAISVNAENVAKASEEFSAVSQQISANSEETSAQANAVSASTEEVNRGLQTVASATQEMSASIQEIAKNATEAAKVADAAMKTAFETNEIVGKLGESSAQIGQVIKVITSIAQKTDLLALNATVEAARAGDVGAGFAVVANEVKELAKQTATATEDISRKIETIQADAKSAVSAIASISGVIDQVNSISGTIATAVEEQSATTSEMSRNISEAAKGAGDVAQNIHGVAQAAQGTSQGATNSQNAAKQLAQMSIQLQDLVNRFKLVPNGHAAMPV